MSEKLSEKGHEQRNKDLEKVELQGAERSAELQNERDKNAAEKETQNHETLDDARREALDKADQNEKESSKSVTPAEKRVDQPAPQGKSLEASFNTQMNEARKSMAAPSRAFSKVIHTKAVEKTSEAVGSTVARPNAILFGSLFAFILTAGLYFWAKYVGYPLSGFETIGAFIIGWIVGIIFDFTRIMVTGKQ